jgi:hypothetical protein
MWTVGSREYMRRDNNGTIHFAFDPGTTDKRIVIEEGVTQGIYVNVNMAGMFMPMYGTLLGVPRCTADPDTTGWGATQLGYLYYNTTSNKFRAWNGAAFANLAWE